MTVITLSEMIVRVSFMIRIEILRGQASIKRVRNLTRDASLIGKLFGKELTIN